MKHHISARNICVDFPVYENSHRSLKKKMLSISTGGKIARDSSSHDIVRAIDDISFDINEGDRVGLMGHNGSGKTTLLRVLNGVYSPIRGTLKKRGRIASLLDVSLGLDQDATGFENIYLKGVVDGLKQSAINSKIEEIAEFTELGEYMNLPVRTYSSGMMVRLAFAISTSIEADILIMDEWLSVGDARFSEKAAERLNKLVDNASILIMASHSPEIVSRICNRIMHLEQGKLIQDNCLHGRNKVDNLFP